MKNLLKLIILASFILCSCGRHMSVTKRKYTKGYYVSHTSKKAPVKGRDLSHTTKQENREAASEKKEIEKPFTNENGDVATYTDPVKSAQPSDPGDKNIARTKSNKPAGLTKIPFVARHLESLIPAKLNKELKKRAKHDVASDTLSLFWIVLLIILLFYLLGILFDGFGLGWVLHLFLLVFLIMLILWLLKVV